MKLTLSSFTEAKYTHKLLWPKPNFLRYLARLIVWHVKTPHYCLFQNRRPAIVGQRLKACSYQIEQGLLLRWGNMLQSYQLTLAPVTNSSSSGLKADHFNTLPIQNVKRWPFMAVLNKSVLLQVASLIFTRTQSHNWGWVRGGAAKLISGVWVVRQGHVRPAMYSISPKDLIKSCWEEFEMNRMIVWTKTSFSTANTHWQIHCKVPLMHEWKTLNRDLHLTCCMPYLIPPPPLNSGHTGPAK